MASIISQAWRSWRSAKAVACMAALALATGIGCATAIFTVANAVLLKPLPYSEPNRWVTLFGASTLSTESDRISAFSLEDLSKYQERTRGFDVFGWYFLGGDYNLTSPGNPEHISGVEVTPSLVDNAGVRPLLGNLFHDSDGPQVALISSRLWKRLGSDPAILGKPLTVNGKSYTVMGVMPGWFQLPMVSVASTDQHSDLWIPIPPHKERSERTIGLYVAYARLKPGVTISQAREDAEHAAKEISKENGSTDGTYTVRLFGLKEFIGREIRPILLLFFAAAALLLLVTCANVAGLLVAKSLGRAHEVAVRVALGVRRIQLARQFFIEGCFIALAAALLGLLASVGLTRLVVSLAADYIPRADEVFVDGRVLVFAVLLAIISALLPSFAPLWQALRTNPTDLLSGGVRSSADARSRRLSRFLVTAEVALAFLLLTVGGALVSEVAALRHTWPGFEPAHLIAFQLNASGATFSSTQEFLSYQNRLLDTLDAIPGVTDAAFANQLPLVGCCLGTTLVPEGQTPRPEFAQQASFVIVSPSYFKTMRIPLLHGRLLTANDNQEDPVPIVINEALARRNWPGRDPIGAFGRVSGNGSRVQVIGVVPDVRNQSLDQETRPEFYLLNAVAPVAEMLFVVRSRLPDASIVPAIRQAMQRTDPNHPIYSIRSMDEIARQSITSQTFASVVITFFALAALLMAVLGIYSVTSYSVRERTIEIGTRMALGAVRGDILRLVLGSAWRMALFGIPVGAVGAIAATWLVTRYLPLQHLNALPYAYSGIAVGGFTTIASMFPAWRATLVTPMVAIRNEPESLLSRSFHALTREHPNHGDELVPLTSLLNGFVEASRRATSFTEALASALDEIRERVHAESAWLFEKTRSAEGNFVLRAASPETNAAYTIPADGFLQNRLKFHSSPLLFVKGDFETALRWASEQKPQYVAEIKQASQLGTSLAAPLRTKRETVGLLLLGPPLQAKGYTRADKVLLQGCAQELALMLENARLTDRMVEQEKIRRDVALAAEVQERLLPRRKMETESTTVEAYFLPARIVGGDCYDFLDSGPNGPAIALADVAGKGVSAALIMAVVQSSLRIITSEKQIAPSDVAARMNDFLHRSTGSSNYATFFYAQLLSRSRQLRYVNAGHNPPLLLRANSSDQRRAVGIEIEELKAGGPVIGLLPGASYEEATIDLHPGDLFLAFSDGVIEALNVNEEEFGEQRLKDVVSRLAHLPVQMIVSSIAEELRKWIGDVPQYDDVTFIVAKVKEEGGG